MFDFYAAQDDKKDAISYDAKFLAETLSFKELVRFGYQQHLTPDFLKPEELMLVYKNLVREQILAQQGIDTEEAALIKGANMLNYEAFKKALIRIAARAQEKLKAVKGGKNLSEALSD